MVAPRGSTPQALTCLREYRWPGNVRELKNVVERAVVLARGEMIEREDLSLSNLATLSDAGEAQTLRPVYEPLTLDELENRHILNTLNIVAWNKSKAATILGVERSTLDRKIKRYELMQPGAIKTED